MTKKPEIIIPFERIGDRLSKDQKTGKQFTFYAPLYTAYLEPQGFLVQDHACHALWHYYVTALENFKDSRKQKYEGNRDTYNLEQLWRSIARLYTVNPNDMEKFWPLIDKQADLIQITKLPDEVAWRSPLGSIIVASSMDYNK